jgi:hypothetical protein
MKAISFLLAALALSLSTVSLQPAAHAADEKADAKKKKKKGDDKAKPVEKKPEEKAKPADKKPEEKKPEDKAKPVDKKPEEKKPEDKAKPPASAKPTPATPPGQNKPAEPKPEPVVAAEPEPAPPLALDIETLRKDRGDRRKASVARSRQQWGALLKDERGTAELQRHSFLVAALQRIRAIAEGKKDSQTVETVSALLAKEDERHSKKMNALRAGAGGLQ